MEGACDRLKKEIDSLKEQNRQLERIYITNTITRNTRADSEHNQENNLNFSEWLTDALSMAHDESLPPEYGANKTAELMAKTLRWKLEKCFCETVSKSPKESVKEYQAHWIHKFDSKLNFDMKMNVEENSSITKISNLSFSFDSDEFPTSEVRPLVEKCSKSGDPTIFFKKIERYWEKYTFRRQFLQEENLESQLHKTTGAYRIVFKYGKEVLAKLQWSIQFDDLAEEFLDNYNVAFTDKGGKMAKDLNIPEDLVNKGSFDQWDVVKCIKNLRIMSQVYDE